jgi:tetratricopeptide (TPR) repeat protein
LSDYFATLAMQRGRVRDALQYWQQATERNPYDASPHYNYASLLRIQGDFDGAEREYDTAIRLSPRGLFEVISKQGRIRVALDRGDVDNAKAELEPLWAQYRIIFPQYFGYVLARLGHEAEARVLVAEMSRDTNASPLSFFYAYYGLKDYDEALVWLRRAIDDHSPQLLPLVRIPNAFPGLQELPGYADVLAHLDSIQRSP